MLAIIHATLVLRDHLLPDGALLIQDGKIADFGEMGKVRIPEGCEILDAGGMYVGPGLIDMHTHAAGRKYFYEDPAGCARHMLLHGATSVMPALYFKMNRERYLECIRIIKEANCPNIIGLYMEGPYLNPNFGAERQNNPWRGPVKREDYMDIIRAAKGLARVWCVAPEREGIEEFCRDVVREMPEAVFAVAHSEATPRQIERLMPLGLRIGTHHTNATGTLEKYPECRGVCVDESVNYNRDIYAELIVDRRGIHVDPYMLRLIRKIKGDDRIILISDACVYDAPVPPGYDGVTDINFDDTGEIAGSKLTLDVACRNMMIHTGCSIVDVFRYASANPARALGLHSKGEIRPGNDADLVIVDHWMHVQQVVLQGRLVCGGEDR